MNPCFCYPNLDYCGSGNLRQLLDLYVPSGEPPKGAWPCIVWIHGGGWRTGDRNRLAGEAHLVRRGLAVAKISYRLSNEATFPAQIDDARAALAYLINRADSLGLNPNQAFVCGHSAGGQIASMLGVGAFEPDAPQVRGCINMAGPTDLVYRFETLPERKLKAGAGANMQAMLGGTWPEIRETAREASPITWIDRQSPAPHLLIFGEKDVLVLPDQATRFQAAMEAAGYPCESVWLPGAGHVDAAFFGSQNLDRVADFCTGLQA